MPKSLSNALKHDLSKLEQLGHKIDQQYQLWREDASDDARVLDLSKQVSQAHEIIVALVSRAEQEQRLAHPKLVAVKREWQQRFDELEQKMDQAQSDIASTLSASTKRHRAADAYLKNQR